MSELILARHHSKCAGVRLILSGVHGNLEQLLYRTGLHNLFERYPTCEDALRQTRAG
jgi:anti-anti-sigma regulatory factor